MAQVACTRCFKIFEAADARPGAAPLCPDCAARAPATRARVASPGPGRVVRPRGGRAAALTLGIALAAGAIAAGGWAILRFRRAPPPPPAPTALEERLEDWRAAGLVPPGGPRDPALSAGRIAAGNAALAADLPARTAEALEAFREALALSPGRSDAAIAGYATAYAEAAGEEADGAELRGAHDIVREALAAASRPELQAAYARLLLLVPSPSNDAEAAAVAARAAAAAPRDPAVLLAHGLSLLRSDAAAAARLLSDAAQAQPGDRRLLTAAARARWAAGDAEGALALADRRLSLDPAHPAALALRADVLASCERLDEAKATLERWRAVEPGSAVPLVLLARIAYQRDDDLAGARRLLDAALALHPDPFTAARALAHRAALELVAGDVPAAEAATAEALRQVPASAPARFQAALLAHRRGDAAALRQSAGVLGDRAGHVAALALAARSAELTGTDDEAQQAWKAVAAAVPKDPAALLGVAGHLARIRASGPALEVARKALERDPAEGRLRRAPSDFWESSASLVDAARRLEAIAQREPRGTATAYAAAAACEVLLGRTVQAKRLATLAAGVLPQWSLPPVLVAQVALDRGDLRKALALASAEADAHPHDGVVLSVRARALEALGRNLDAEQAWREAVEARADLVTARLGLARVLARRGAGADARAALRALLADEPSLGEARGALLALEAAPPQPVAADGGGR